MEYTDKADNDSTLSVGQRYAEIAAAVARHGLGIVADAFGLTIGRKAAPDETALTQAAHLRMALEELGTTFIKVGQTLATRGDLLPADYRDELAKLQDSVEPIPSEDVVAEVERELGGPISKFFKSFDTAPLASASISQVHGAKLADGRHVIVKVRKPRVDEVVALGATAAQALLGPSFRLTKHRGEALPCDLAPRVFATVHPSAILRAPDARTRREELAKFVADLKIAGSAMKD